MPRKRIRGRTSFSPEIADRILDRLTEGESLRQICRDPTMPAKSTIFCWLQDHNDFADQYACVKQMQIFDLYDEILTIARSRVFNTEKIREKKLKLQTLFRLVTHLSAKKYRISLDGLG